MERPGRLEALVELLVVELRTSKSGILSSELQHLQSSNASTIE